MSLARFGWLRESKSGFVHEREREREREREWNHIRWLGRRWQQQKQHRRKHGGSNSRDSSDGGSSGSLSDGGGSRTNDDERLRDLAAMGEKRAMREGRNVGDLWELRGRDKRESNMRVNMFLLKEKREITFENKQLYKCLTTAFCIFCKKKTYFFYFIY